MDLKETLRQFNRITKDIDDVYRQMAKKYGIGECSFWIIYTLRLADKPLTQSSICSQMYQPKQTVNSAVKKLESDGLIKSVFLDDKRKKFIILTEKGKAAANSTADMVIDAETQSFSRFPEEKRRLLLEMLEDYSISIRNITERLSGEKNEYPDI